MTTTAPLGGTTNPRAGLISTWDKTAVKLLYGQAFRGPNSYERFYTDGLTQKTNPDLKPEKIDTYEAVVEQELGQHFKASVAGYVYYVHDLIDQTSDGYFLMYRNLDEVRGHVGSHRRECAAELADRRSHGVDDHGGASGIQGLDHGALGTTPTPAHIASPDCGHSRILPPDRQQP